VGIADDCPEYISCPAHIPFKCPNGECRGSFEDCPQPVSCPYSAKVEDKLVKCIDGSCRDLQSECLSTDFKASDYESSVQCPDGKRMKSYSLCGTQRTCPIGHIKCWNGVCAKSLQDCHYYYMDNINYRVDPETDCIINLNDNTPFFCKGKCNFTETECYKEIQCPDRLVMCTDGGCREKAEDCPTETTCPVEKPVKCFDGTCTTSISSCLEMTDCPKYTRRCPNGQCVSIESPCGTDVTCPISVPVKCYDNTCRRSFEDCPPMPTCPHDRPHLCSDGSCQPSIDHCYLESQCGRNQTKCPDFTCVDSLDKCHVIQGCPPGRYLCPDTSCRTSYSQCMNDTCPTSKPYKCIDGMCVQDEKECNSEATGCPYHTPYKCSDGECVKNINECERDIREVSILCPDGAAADDIDSCYSVYGCPSQYPFMCHDGSCVNLRREICPVSKCSANLPYRCPNGLCVTDRGKCLTFDGLTECRDPSDARCGNGMCMRRSEFCRPLLPCHQGYVRCADGSCRPHELLCPITDAYSCNVNIIDQSHRCPNGLCVDDREKCRINETSDGCAGKLKCVGDDYEVEHFGKCVSDRENCKLGENDYLANGCRNGAMYRDYDGSCNNSLTNTEMVTVCKPGRIINSQGDCTDLSIMLADEYLNSTIIGNRSVIRPYVCADGEVRQISFRPFGGESADEISCKPRVVCPSTTPYLCYDKSCESDPRNCPSVSKEIPSEYNECPTTRPILCSSGVCVAKVQECLRPDPKCSPSEPLQCANGLCVDSYAKCLPNSVRRDSSKICSRNDSLVFLCPDGSCAINSHSCLSIISGCNDPYKPIKTSDGGCSATLDTNPITTCALNEFKVCEDGICRRTCSDYNGCPISK